MRSTVAALLLFAGVAWAADQPLRMVLVKQLPSFWLASVLSPDGNSVAFADQSGLCIQDLTTGRLRQMLAHSGGDFEMFTDLAFSPDGQSLFCVRYSRRLGAGGPSPGVAGFAPVQRELYRIPLSGGERQRIADTHIPFRISPDGQRIAYAVFENGVSSVVLASAADWTVQRKLPSPGGCVWSPDGAAIAGMAYRKDHQTVTVSTVSTSTGEKKELLSARDLRPNAGDENLVWGRESGMLMIRIKGKEYPAGGAVWQYAMPGGVLRQVTPDGDKYTGIVSASRDGLTLLVRRPALSLWDAISQFFGGPGPEPLARELVLIRFRK
jgi:Tol biopolymer transport system component